MEEVEEKGYTMRIGLNEPAVKCAKEEFEASVEKAKAILVQRLKEAVEITPCSVSASKT
jgi:hypothetical protein